DDRPATAVREADVARRAAAGELEGHVQPRVRRRAGAVGDVTGKLTERVGGALDAARARGPRAGPAARAGGALHGRRRRPTGGVGDERAGRAAGDGRAAAVGGGHLDAHAVVGVGVVERVRDAARAGDRGAVGAVGVAAQPALVIARRRAVPLPERRG